MIMDAGIEALIALPLLIQIFGLSFVVIIDPYISREQRRVMLIINLLVLGLLIRDLAAHQLDVIGTMPFLRTLLAIYGYVTRPVLIVMYLYLVKASRKYTAAWVLVGINAVIYLTALFSGICFYIDEGNQFHRGPLGYTVHIVGLILLLYTLRTAVIEYGGIRMRSSVIPVVIVALIVAALILDTVVDYRKYPVTFITAVVASANVFHYIGLHLQFVREHENALQAEQRIQIMMTQIQPHFLFNTIATIKALCSKDPKKAAEVAEKFGTYLRQNLNTLNASGLIPFRKELEHTKLYAEIEMVRFDNIRVEYKVYDDDFKLPPLTLQPIVENSIRHGVRIREQGIVEVTARHEENHHVIEVRDNGVGFDPDDTVSSNGQHIGLSNIRERIEGMCGGSLIIDSIKGTGTTVKIIIPCGEVKQ